MALLHKRATELIREIAKISDTRFA